MSRPPAHAPPYAVPRALANAHLQSVLGATALRRPGVAGAARALLAGSRDVLVDGGEGVRLLGHHSPADVGCPHGLVVLIHGWEGCADSLYVLSAAARLHAAGFDVFRLNLRDHGPTHHLNEDLFHSCRLDETVAAVRDVAGRWPDRPLHLVGFSLGGNFALRIAAAAPHAGIELGRVVALCPVLDPARTMHELETGWFVYRWHFLRRWRRSLLRKQALFPHRYRFGDLRRLRTLSATTEFFVREYTAFGHVDDYLAGYAITGDRLAGLTVPSWLIAADDDPVIPAGDLARLSAPPALSVHLTRGGGHCGYLADWRLNSWMDEALVTLLSTGAADAGVADARFSPGGVLETAQARRCR